MTIDNMNLQLSLLLASGKLHPCASNAVREALALLDVAVQGNDIPGSMPVAVAAKKIQVNARQSFGA